MQARVRTDMHSTAQQQNQAQGNRKMIFQAMTVQPAICERNVCLIAHDPLHSASQASLFHVLDNGRAISSVADLR